MSPYIKESRWGGIPAYYERLQGSAQRLQRCTAEAQRYIGVSYFEQFTGKKWVRNWKGWCPGKIPWCFNSFTGNSKSFAI
jgi:hypothetical protein